MNFSTIAHSIPVAVLLALAPLPLSAQNPTPPPAPAKPLELRLFDFPGGEPAEFLSAVDKTFEVEWSQIAAIPENARKLRIPPMRMRVATAQEVFNVANKLTAETPNLGAWMTIPGQGNISAVLYTLGRSSSSPPALEVRAIPLRDVPGEKWDELLQLLDESLSQVLPPRSKANEAAVAPFNIKIHRTAGMLMITATKDYIERIETLAVALRTGMAQARGTTAPAETLAPSKLVPLPGVAANDAKLLDEILAKATEAWTSAQEEQGAKVHSRARFTYLPDLRGVLLVGPSEWITFAEQVASEWAARQTDSEAVAVAEGLKARAFSIAGLPQETVGRIVEELQMHAEKLRAVQEKLAAQTGRAAGGGVLIQGQPNAVEALQVLLVTGNDAGLEFARSFIEEAKASMEKSANVVKYVTVDGEVRSPARMIWTQDLTVLGAIAACGGVTEFANEKLRLIRDKETLTLSRNQMSKDAKKDMSLQPGDRLEVGKANFELK